MYKLRARKDHMSCGIGTRTHRYHHTRRHHGSAIDFSSSVETETTNDDENILRNYHLPRFRSPSPIMRAYKRTQVVFFLYHMVLFYKIFMLVHVCSHISY